MGETDLRRGAPTSPALSQGLADLRREKELMQSVYFFTSEKIL